MSQRKMIPPLVGSTGNQTAIDQQRFAIQKEILWVIWIVIDVDTDLTTGGESQNVAIGGEHMIFDGQAEQIPYQQLWLNHAYLPACQGRQFSICGDYTACDTLNFPHR